MVWSTKVASARRVNTKDWGWGCSIFGMRSVHSEQPQFISDMGQEVLFPRVKLARAHNTDPKSLLWLYTQWKEEGNAWEVGKSGDSWLSTKPFGTKITRPNLWNKSQPSERSTQLHWVALLKTAVFSLTLGDTQISWVIRPYLQENFHSRYLQSKVRP